MFSTKNINSKLVPAFLLAATVCMLSCRASGRISIEKNPHSKVHQNREKSKICSLTPEYPFTNQIA